MSTKTVISGVLGAITGAIQGWAYSGTPYGAIVGAVIGAGVGIAGSLLNTPPENPSAGVPLQKLMTPSNVIGGVIPDLLGTAKIVGVFLCYGLERVEEEYAEQESGKGGGGPDPQVTGHKYYMSWVQLLCTGPVDTLYSILEDNDKVVWGGTLSRPASGKETITTSNGTVHFYFGTATQETDSVLTEIIGDATLTPAYRGMCYAVFDDYCIGNYNRCPSVKFVLRKVPDIAAITAVNPGVTLHTIGSFDYNPIYALYYILNTLTGLPAEWLNTTAFASVAQTVSTEAHGISICFDQYQTASDYLENICAHLNMLLPYGVDGKFSPKLIRNDYVVANLPLIDENVIMDEPSFTRKSWIDTYNEIKVGYTEIYDGLSDSFAISGDRFEMCYGDNEHYTVSTESTYEWVYTWEVVYGDIAAHVEGEDPPIEELSWAKTATGESIVYRAPLSLVESGKDTLTLSVSGDEVDEKQITLNVCPGECYVESITINYSTLTMATNETQALSMTVLPEAGDVQSYTWLLVGVGSLSTDEGLTTTYSSPAEQCFGSVSATIYAVCNGEAKDDITITIEPDCSNSETIGYTSLEMLLGQTQNLQVMDSHNGPYRWEISSGGGSLNTDQGLLVTYTAPKTNEDCLLNPTITLYCCSYPMDSITLAIRSPHFDYNKVAYFSTEQQDTSDGLTCRYHVVPIAHRCDGSAPRTWGGPACGSDAASRYVGSCPECAVLKYWDEHCTPCWGVWCYDRTADMAHAITNCEAKGTTTWVLDKTYTVHCTGYCGQDAVQDVREASMKTNACCPGALL